MTGSILVGQNANSTVVLSTGGFPVAGISADVSYQTMNIKKFAWLRAAE
jgi:hypothetical protein